MHHLQPQHLRRRPVARTAVLAIVLLFLAGCGLVDQQATAPATPTSAASTPAPVSPNDSRSSAVPPDADAGGDPPSSDEVASGGGDGATEDTTGTGGGSGNRSGGDRAGGGNDGSSGDDQRLADRTLTRGDSGPAVRRLQQRLEDLHYWVGPADGVFGQLTEQAVFAFQGVEGIAVDGVVGPNTRAHLADATPPQPRSNGGDLIEVDEQARVVMDVRGGEVRWTWHTSTGTNEHYQHPDGHTALAETPNGRQTIDWQVDGVRQGDLGPLWRPKYFNADGIAIHGYPSVPATPSSHGCVRVTKPAMDFIWANDIAPKGSTVWVYGRTP